MLATPKLSFHKDLIQGCEGTVYKWWSAHLELHPLRLEFTINHETEEYMGQRNILRLTVLLCRLYQR